MMEYLILPKKYAFEAKKDIFKLVNNKIPANYPQRREFCGEDQPDLHVLENSPFFGFIFRVHSPDKSCFS